MTWNLWLDDTRDPEDALYCPRRLEGEPLHPEMTAHIRAGLKAENVVWAKSAVEAIRLISERGFPAYYALDYNLGSPSQNVDEFLDWLFLRVEGPVKGACHSADYDARSEVNRRIRDFNAKSA